MILHNICLPRLYNDQTTKISPEHPRNLTVLPWKQRFRICLVSVGGDFTERKPKATRTLCTLGEERWSSPSDTGYFSSQNRAGKTTERRATHRENLEPPRVRLVESKSLSRVRLFATPWTIQSMEFSRPGYWSAFPFCRGSSQPRDQSQVSHIAGGFFTIWATRKAL